MTQTEHRRASARTAHARRKSDPTYALKKREASRRTVWKKKNLPAPTRPEPTACEICGGTTKGKRLALDHDHRNERFRGWLCFKCNVGLGYFRDSSDLLVAAARYLRSTELV